MKNRLFYIAETVLPSRMANSVHIMKMCQGFQQNDCEVTLIVPDLESNVKTEDVLGFYGIKERFEIVRLPIGRGPGSSLLYVRKAVAYARKNGAQYIFTRSVSTCIWAFFYGVRYALEHHRPPGTLHEKIAFFFASRAKNLLFLVVITHALKKIMKDCGWGNLPMVVLPDAVDAENYHPSGNGDLNGRAVFGYSGHLYKGRGIDIIVEMARDLTESRFVIIGGDDDNIAYWKQYVADQNLRNIDFMGFIPNHEIPMALSKFDVLLMPYQRKVGLRDPKANTAEWMSPMKMFEYMATGKAIISSDLPVLREILRQEENSMLVTCDETAEWTAAARKLLGTPELMKRLGEEARREVLEKYTWRGRAKVVLERMREG